jgi:hypothetical protein
VRPGKTRSPVTDGGPGANHRVGPVDAVIRRRPPPEVAAASGSTSGGRGGSSAFDPQLFTILEIPRAPAEISTSDVRARAVARLRGIPCLPVGSGRRGWGRTGRTGGGDEDARRRRGPGSAGDSEAQRRTGLQRLGELRHVQRPVEPRRRAGGRSRKAPTGSTRRPNTPNDSTARRGSPCGRPSARSARAT